MIYQKKFLKKNKLKIDFLTGKTEYKERKKILKIKKW